MYGGPLDGAEYDENIAAELMSPLTKAIYVYLVKNYGLPINSKSPRSSNDSKLFTNLTRPRFGKRSLYGPGAVMKIIQVKKWIIIAREVKFLFNNIHMLVRWE